MLDSRQSVSEQAPWECHEHEDSFFLMSPTSARTPANWVFLTFFPLQCTVTCGGGVQTRSVHCVQQGRPSSSCLLHQKPPVLRACNTNFCPAPEKRGKGPQAPLIFQELSILDCAPCISHSSRACCSRQRPCDWYSLGWYTMNLWGSYCQTDFVCKGWREQLMP
jgi:hypothetical protein